MTMPVSTQVNLVRVVYGSETPALDDLAENLHEATKLDRTLAVVEMRGAALLETYPELSTNALRCVKEHDGYVPVPLPRVALPDGTLADLLHRRRSVPSFSGSSIALEDLAALLTTAYGVLRVDGAGDPTPGLAHRTVASGGGLFPLELYVLALRVDGLAEGVYHFDPLRHRLELVRTVELLDALAPALAADDFLDAAVGVCVTGVFWRSRFKYGPRGYRFTLLEAGEVAQNVVLAAAALGLACCPCGGFFDRQLDALLEVDGVDESTLLVLFAGGGR